MKRFAAWAIGSKTKYAHDPFFRTGWNVILLQGIFAVLLLFFFTVAFNYLYQDVIETLLSGIQESLTSVNNISAEEIFRSTQEAKGENLRFVFLITAITTVIVGCIIGYVTLTPARHALASQKRFISDVAHEIRTPLSIIKTNSEVALLNRDLDAETRMTLTSNVEELDRISEIINNLLSFSNWMRPERITLSPVDFGDALDAAMKRLRTLTETKKLQVLIERKSPLLVMGNSAALEQIAANVIKNSATYTPAGGRITVSAGPDRYGDVLFTVADNGMGIPRKDLPHIFDPFFRSDRSRNRQSGSSGLGLTIVAELIKMHRGRITVGSMLGRGTTVRILLPTPSSALSRGEENSLKENPREDKQNETSVDFFVRS